MIDLRDDAMASDLSVAALLLTIDSGRAARVLRELGEEQLDRVMAAMRQLEGVDLDRAEIQSILVSAVRRLGRSDRGEDDSAMPGGETTDAASARRRFAIFEALPSEELAELLSREHPQIAAVFLAHLTRKKAAGVVHHMPHHRRSDQLYRIATLDRTPPDVVERILEVMAKKVEEMGLTAHRPEPIGWVKAAAEILNNLGGAESAILEAIGEANDMIAESIREEMFTFEDLANLDHKSTQRVLRSVDSKTLALALRSAPLAVEATIFDNLSKRAVEAVVEKREALGNLPMTQVLEARQDIMRQVRELATRGEVTRTPEK